MKGDVANDNRSRDVGISRVSGDNHVYPLGTLDTVQLDDRQAEIYRFFGVAITATQATPTPTATAARMPSSWVESVSGNVDLQSLVCSAEFTWPCEWALAVIMCESGGNPQALSPYGDAGLFQVATVHGYSQAQLFDPVFNTRYAHELYNGGSGTGNWPNCP